MQDQKNRQKVAIWARSHKFVELYLRNWGTYRQSELLSSNISSTCLHNMVNFGPLAAEIVSLAWGTPGNFNGFRRLRSVTAWYYCIVMGVSQTLRRWTEGATYIRQGGHHVGHWPTFLVLFKLLVLYKSFTDWITHSLTYSVTFPLNSSGNAAASDVLMHY